MIRPATTTVCFMILVASSVFGQAEQPSLDGAMSAIRKAADNFPPTFSSEAEQANVLRLWHWAESGLRASLEAKTAPEKELELLLGEIYRLGHNLDIEGAGDNAVSHLNRAITLDPTNPKPYLLLGRHLTFSGSYTDGELALLHAYVLSRPENLVDLQFLLANNYYFQKRFALTLAMISRIPPDHPAARASAVIRDSSRQALETHAPRTIEVDVP